jgi:hypothetical protein
MRKSGIDGCGRIIPDRLYPQIRDGVSAKKPMGLTISSGDADAMVRTRPERVPMNAGITPDIAIGGADADQPAVRRWYTVAQNAFQTWECGCAAVHLPSQALQRTLLVRTRAKNENLPKKNGMSTYTIGMLFGVFFEQGLPLAQRKKAFQALRKA